MGVDSEDVLSVALDSFADGIGSYQFEAVNFMSGDKPFASNTSVRWEIASLTSNGASITQDGLLTFTKPGEIVVKATSQENAEVSAIYTVRVGGVTETDVFWDYPSQNTQIAFDESNNSKTLAVQVSGTSLTATFTINALVQPSDITSVDKSFTIEVVSGDGVEINGNQVTFTKGGTVQLKLSFVNYTDVVKYININVLTSVFDYDPAAEFYRFGTENQVPIRLVDGLNLEGVSFVGEPLAGENYQAQVVIDAEVDSVTGETIYLMEFSGGGKITIYAKAGESVLDSFVVQIIDGAVNVSNANQAFSGSKSMCLVDDITRSTGSISVGKGCYLYGNGYSITDQNNYTSKNGGFLSLSGTMDNVKIIGHYVDNYYAGSSVTEQSEYYKTVSAVTISTSGAEIHNSYIENGKYAVRLYGMGGEVTISNTSLVGGAVSLGVVNINSQLVLNLHNIKIVQLGDKDFMGAGFGFDEGGEERVTVNFSGEDNTLQNFATKSMISKLPSDYQTVANTLWNELGAYKFNYDNETYLHVGTLVRLDDINQKPTFNFAEGCNLAGKMSNFVRSEFGINGMLFALDNTISGVKEYVEGVNGFGGIIGEWITNKPSHTFAYNPLLPKVTVNETTMRIEYTGGSNPTVNADDTLKNNFSAIKYGYDAKFTTNEEETLPLYYTITVIDEGGQEINDLTAIGKGKYTVTYTLFDNYEPNNIGQASRYTYVVSFTVDIFRAKPTITWNTSAYSTQPSDVQNDNNLDFTGVGHYIQAEKKFDTIGFIPLKTYYDIVYKLNLVKDLGLQIVDADGNDITATATVTLKGLQNATLNGSDWYNKDFEQSENAPSGKDVSYSIYARVFTITINVTDSQGVSNSAEIKVAFYSPTLGRGEGWIKS